METIRATYQAPFVRDDAGALRGALVVRTSRALERELPLQGEPSPIAARAAEQQAVMIGRLGSCGVKVQVVEPPEDAPLAALCADYAVIFRDGAFLMRPSDAAQRRGMALVEGWLEAIHFPIVGRIEAPGLLDGGDVLRAGDTVFVGVPHVPQSDVGIRQTARGNAFGREQLAAYARSLGLKVVEVPLSSEARRLRSVASIVDAETVLYAPGIIDGSLAFAPFKRIEVPRGEDFGAGVLTLGPRRVLANVRFRTVLPLLRRAKIGVEAIDLWEFGKIGATPSSLVLALKRE